MICTSKEVYEFYCQRVTQPSWAMQHVFEKKRVVSIDRIIELNSGKPQTRQNYNYAAQNLCHLLKIVRKSPERSLAAYLLQLSQTPGTIIDAAKRAAFAAKWYTKLTGEPKHCIYFGIPKYQQEHFSRIQDLVLRGHPNAEWR